MSQYIYYANGGSGNHGCEAIIRSLESILKSEQKNLSLSIAPDQDAKYGLSKLVNTLSVWDVSHKNYAYLKSYFDLKFKGSKYSLDIFPYRYHLRNFDRTQPRLALSVGGDNYCYGGADFYAELDNVFHEVGIQTALIGCSIEPEVLSNSIVKKDLESHKLIIARESLTFNALQQNGLHNVMLLPDPAFLLKTDYQKSQIEDINDNTVGINLSPMVNQHSSSPNIISKNIDSLICYILDTSDMKIALIPHVVWKESNDFETLLPLYEKYKNTNRILLVNDCNAEELKGYIARCRFVVAARTHATIAAYSSCIPTLAIGYSIKAKGIAKDIFGTYNNYVISAQSISTDSDLISAFKWLYDNEADIRRHLKMFMPGYCNRANKIKEALLSITQ